MPPGCSLSPRAEAPPRLNDKDSRLANANNGARNNDRWGKDEERAHIAETEIIALRAGDRSQRARYQADDQRHNGGCNKRERDPQGGQNYPSNDLTDRSGCSDRLREPYRYRQD